MGGKLIFPGGGVYHATKHAVEALSDALRFEVDGFGIEVVIIEPGLIMTEFGETAVGSRSARPRSDGPYGQVQRRGRRGDGRRVRGPDGKARRPAPRPSRRRSSRRSPRAARSPRYKVTPSAHMIMGINTVLTDRGWDRFVSSQFSRPKPE